MAERVVIAKHKMIISFQLLDGSDKSISKRYPLRFSSVVIKEIILEEVANPYNLCGNWLVMEGTNWGMTKSAWIDRILFENNGFKIAFEEIK